MADKKMILLVQRLHEKTFLGKVPWEQSVDEGVFQASFTDYSIRLLRRPTSYPEMDPESEDMVLQIFNEKGDLIEALDDTQFKKEDFNGVYPFIFLAEIHAMARRAVMGLDKAIDSLLSDLDN